jgi:predicted nuclease with TOPRIM domain
MYGVNVNDMHFAMVNAIKELAEKLAEENDTLREENKELHDAIKALRSRMDAFEQTIKLAAS